VKELILGGVRSGKSRLAEVRARDSGLEVVYVATARLADDEELQRRILAHRRRRPAHWRTIEEPIALGATLRAHTAPDRCVLVECVTLWLTNLLCCEDAALFARERSALLAALSSTPGNIIMVGNECGLGVMPLGQLTRQFIDEAGHLHQELASLCDRVCLTVAGLPLVIKGLPPQGAWT
jgi:adenosylcobinamide kinase / adenosylcobinamide-phosphate guanylyltransferase